MNFLYKYVESEDYTQIIDDGLIEFGILRLTKGRHFVNIEDNKETALIILSGKCTIKCDVYEWESIGERNSVFEGEAYAVYIPFKYKYEIFSEGVEIAICKALSNHKSEPVLITPADVKCRIVGKSNWERRVCDIIDLDVNAKRLLVGETFNSPGNWSSYPPHKHDEDNLHKETKMGEVYFYKVNPKQGFGMQRIYTQDKKLEEVYVVENNDVVLIPKGYHPVVAAPEYSLYYLWMLVGENRILIPSDDPVHEWIRIEK